MKEIWKDISGYEDMYQISNFGNLRAIKSSSSGEKSCFIKTPTLTHKGYENISLYKNGKRNFFRIHRLVAEYFIDNPNNYPQVNHIDGNKSNNRVDNLEWCNNSQNMKHAYDNGLCSRAKPILQFDKNGNFIKKWKTISDIYKQFGKIDNGCISAVCNKKRKSAYGYIWKYAEGE